MNWDNYFRYEPSSGRLFWRLDIGRAKEGQEAGTITKWGYRDVKLHHKKYKVHRIAWDMCFPEDKLATGEYIDHINHDKLDNSISNLRKVDSFGNGRNQSFNRANTSGVMGVYAGKNNTWRAMIKVGQRQVYLGSFSCFVTAVAARKAAEIKYGFHENHGAKNEIKE